MLTHPNSQLAGRMEIKMNNLEKIKTFFAIFLAITYGFISPYIYYTYTKYNFTRLLVSVFIILFILDKLCKEIKLKQFDLFYIIGKILRISIFIGIVLNEIINFFI